MAIPLFQTVSKSRLNALRQLLQKKFRREQKKCFIEGPHLLEEAMKARVPVEVILVTQTALHHVLQLPWFGEICDGGTATVFMIGEHELNSISDTMTSQGVLAVIEERPAAIDALFETLPQTGIFIALEGVSDPGNVGTIIRTCDWFGAAGVILGEETADLFNPKVVRASQGSIFHLPVVPDVSLASVLRRFQRHEYHVIGTAVKGAAPAQDYPPPPKSVLVFGNEARGVSAEILHICDQLITIPGCGKAESLNVSVACGVTLGLARWGNFKK